jgi:hypothetical protein
MGKSDRAFVVGALALLTALFPEVSVAWKWVLLSGALLSIWTCNARIRATLGECWKQEEAL